MRLLLVTRCGCTRRIDILGEEGERPPLVYGIPLSPDHATRFVAEDAVTERAIECAIRQFVLESREPTAPWEAPTYLYREKV